MQQRQNLRPLLVAPASVITAIVLALATLPLGLAATPARADALEQTKAPQPATVKEERTAVRKRVVKVRKTTRVSRAAALPRFAHYPPAHLALVGVDWTRVALRPVAVAVVRAPPMVRARY